MKFELKYGLGISPVEITGVAESDGIGKCKICSVYTRWIDTRSNTFLCSEECSFIYYEKVNAIDENNEYMKFIKDEVNYISKGKGEKKDILIVVKDQFHYFKQCVDSVLEHTDDFRLCIWNNNSKSIIEEYIYYIENKLKESNNSIMYYKSKENIGFVEPNNWLFEHSNYPYVICLNSDVIARRNWDCLMIGLLKEQKDLGIVGYYGGLLDEDYVGYSSAKGKNAEYISGSCLCIERDFCVKIGGLFDKNIDFAYGEDADLSLRVRNYGKGVYAIYTPLVYHFENKTIRHLVESDKEFERLSIERFKKNHEYIKNKWKSALSKNK